ncbi:MAG: TldD/PmbA family protein [Candidatus Aminicenantes bacterium]|nr:TldD/PmbA family protein [Candidatus Aminicenantes bacterium]
MSGQKESTGLMNLAESLASFGKTQGADEIEITVVEGMEFDVDVRYGKIENLIEAGSKYLAMRVIKEKRTAFATSSDLSMDTLQQLMKNAIRRTEYANLDEYTGLPNPSKSTFDQASLNIYDPEISELDPKKKIALAMETEKIALADRRITNSHGASFETKEIKTHLVNSFGFIGEYKETVCSLSVGVQAGETDEKVEDFWSSSQRYFKDLEPPEKIAQRAVERTVRQIRPRKIQTQNVSVIFEPPMTSWLLGFLFSCVSGMAVYQKLSFLADKLGEKIGNDNITVYDDGHMPGKLGTRPFDSEGVPTSQNTVIQKGMLKNFLCDTYAARKLKLQSTGNADGAGVGPNNFYLQAGEFSPEEIIKSTAKGLILTRTLGHGLNPVTGDISRGAFGLWVVKGEIAYPVSEITIAGNLGKILNQIEMVGNDLEFRSPISGPTIKIQQLTIAGE